MRQLRIVFVLVLQGFFLNSLCGQSVEKPVLKNGRSVEEWIVDRIIVPPFKGGDFKVMTGFQIDEKGKVQEVMIYDAPYIDLSIHVYNGIKKSPKWNPAKDVDGNPVKARYIIALDFDSGTVSSVSDPVEWFFSDGIILTREGIAQLYNVDLESIDYVIPPKFMGISDLGVFRRWLMPGLKYPAEAPDAKIQGKVVAGFTIDKEGSLTDIDFVTSSHPALAGEVDRLLKTSPKWTPAYDGEGRPKEVRLRMVFDFSVVARP